MVERIITKIIIFKDYNEQYDYKYHPSRCELIFIELLIPGKLYWRGCQIQRLPPAILLTDKS